MSSNTHIESPGTLRPSQIMFNSGPGSLVQMVHDSVLMLGLDMWYSDKKYYNIIQHPDLEKLLKKSHFRVPIQVGKSKIIPCTSFPKWGVCSNKQCGRLQRHPAKPPPSKSSFSCVACNSELYAADFVVTCNNGHLDEFPWARWAHTKTSKICKEYPRLKFGAFGKGPGLADCYVKCLDCGALQTCGKATLRDGLKDIIPVCSGRRPWLGDSVQCVDKNGERMHAYGIQTSSTALYHPVTATALDIPKWMHPIQNCISDNISGLRDMLGMGTRYSDIARKHPKFSEIRRKYSEDEIVAHLKRRLETDNGNENSIISETEIRNSEYDDFMNSQSEDYGTKLVIDDEIIDKTLEDYIYSLKRVGRLTEYRVLCAFMRGQMPDPYAQSSEEYCKIHKKSIDWYPAIKNKGEGFLFSVREDKLRQWERLPAVSRRCQPILESFNSLHRNVDNSDDPRITPRYILLHTLAHVIIRNVASDAGYSEASIRERLYCGNMHNGILLYTATPSSDGSLGGLVRQGTKENFARLLRSAVQRIAYCTRDPLCATDDPAKRKKGHTPLYTRVNGSACYGCALLPETSCENQNRLLDRRLLFDHEYGFFKEWFR